MGTRGKEPRHGPKPGVELFEVEGWPWFYRKPYPRGDKFRVRGRHRETGLVKQFTLASTNLTDAKREVIEKAAEEKKAHEEKLKNPEPVEPKDTTISKALESWLTKIDVRPATKKDYEASVELYKRAIGEDRIVGEVLLQDVEDLFYVRKSTDKAEGWADRSGKTKIKHRMQLVRFWKFCVNHGFARTNIPAMVEIAKKWRDEVRLANQTTGQGLTIEEARALLAACKDKFIVQYERDHYGHAEKVEAEVEPPDYLWLFVLIALRTGLRSSNILPTPDASKPGLTWRHVNLKEKVIRIEAALMKNGLPFVQPLHEELADELKKVQKRLRRVPSGDEPIIREAPAELKKAFHAALARAKLGDRGFRIHDLRHAFVSWLGMTCTHSIMQRLAGHSAVNVTDRYGQHQELEVLRTGITSLPRLLIDNVTQEKKKSSG